MKLPLFKDKTFIADINIYDEQLIYKLDKIEAYVIGHSCSSFKDFVEGVYEKFLQKETDNKANIAEKKLQDKQIEKLTKEIESLRDQLNIAEGRVTEHQSQIDTLTQENISKDGTISQVQSQLQNLTSDLLNSLIDSAGYIDNARLKGKTAEVILKSQEEKIDSLLALIGVTPIQGEGMSFDGKFQSAEELENTTDKSKDGIVAESISRGFRTENACIKPQKVVVYKYIESNDET